MPKNINTRITTPTFNTGVTAQVKQNNVAMPGPSDPGNINTFLKAFGGFHEAVEKANVYWTKDNVKAAQEALRKNPDADPQDVIKNIKASSLGINRGDGVAETMYAFQGDLLGQRVETIFENKLKENNYFKGLDAAEAEKARRGLLSDIQSGMLPADWATKGDGYLGQTINTYLVRADKESFATTIEAQRIKNEENATNLIAVKIKDMLVSMTGFKPSRS